MSTLTKPEPVLRVSESSNDGENGETKVHFEPIVTLPEIELVTNEENEDELVKLRAKLFRFDTTVPNEPEWKERGTGEVKMLRHKETNAIRVVMRRDKTLKICANHFITPWMELKPSYGSNRAWVWTVLADFADETSKSECLAIRFATPDIANQWKNKFEEAKIILREKCELYNSEEEILEISNKSDDTENAKDDGEDADDEKNVADLMKNLNVENN